MRNRKSKGEENGNLPWIFHKVNVKVYEWLIRAATVLQRRTNKCSPKAKKITLVVSTALFTVLNVLGVLHSFRQKAIPRNSSSNIKTISAEKSQTQENAWVEIGRLKRFMHYVDSLEVSEEGKRVRDSIFTLHPKLVDSVQDLIKYYSE